ncbi:hypothetical protein [Streptomyces sp. NPDC001388]|uniref:hypothetical protein n=1 Tax=Streptomyces sp. NPDC001388 TaxID=3364568 RepID=UPI0036D18C7A
MTHRRSGYRTHLAVDRRPAVTPPRAAHTVPRTPPWPAGLDEPAALPRTNEPERAHPRAERP